LSKQGSGRRPAQNDKISSVFSFHRALRFVSIVDQNGEMVASMGRPGLKSLEPEQLTATIYTRAAIARGMTEGMNEYHGKIRTAIVIRDRLTMICFFGVGRMFIVFADPEFPIGETERLGQMLDGLGIDVTSQERPMAHDGP